MRHRQRVVLLGGGYATLHAYATLARRRRRQISRGDLEIVVVSADDHHSFHGFTGEVLAGDLPLDVTRTPLREVMPRATVVHAEVTHVDRVTRTVRFRRVSAWGSPEESLSYDELVVATGGREPVAGLVGLAEHGFTLRSPGDVMRLLRALAMLEHPSCATGLDNAADLVVIGGGLAGVEMAAALAARPTRWTGRRVRLVHAGTSLLPDLRATQPRLARRADRELARLGVEVVGGVRVIRVDRGRVVLDDGQVLPAAITLGTTGQRAVALPGLEGLDGDVSGRLTVDSALRVEPRLWAAGDAACVRHPVTGIPVTTNALWAIKAGDHLGRNLARSLASREPTSFRYLGLGQAASFGVGRGVAELYGVPLTGWGAWVMRLAFFLRFMPSRAKAAEALSHLTARDARQRRRSVVTVLLHHGARGATPRPLATTSRPSAVSTSRRPTPRLPVAPAETLPDVA